ncbi:ISLR2 [Branchiostoma lanceolatum]|uniref:ISLR2 protein n=1 Tax=Branchiostoma lanceolatum TaxID=7740 RepID=A0A8J9ZC51_BRALA|nr:ISLR2 [Branchiostoma lanceolatum]
MYMSTVFCSGLKLEAIPGDIPPNTSRLDLGFNNIRNITHLPPLPQVYSIDLKFNSIDSMSWLSLRVLPSLQYLLMRQNRLRHVKLDTVVRNVPKLKYVDFSYNELMSFSPNDLGWPQVTKAIIHDNPVRCDCNMAWLVVKLACLETCTEDDEVCCSSCSACLLVDGEKRERLRCKTPGRLESFLMSEVSTEMPDCKNEAAQSEVGLIPVDQNELDFEQVQLKQTTTTHVAQTDAVSASFRQGTDSYDRNRTTSLIGNFTMANTAPPLPTTKSFEKLVTAMAVALSCIALMIFSRLLHKVMIKGAKVTAE